MHRRQFLQSLVVGSLGAGGLLPQKVLSLGRMTNKPSVLVLGAGMAGLSAASRLHQAGCKVTVLEGRNRVGGRIYTPRDFGVPIDMGAAWVHDPKGNPLSKLIAQNKLTLFPTDFGNEEAWRASGGYFPDGPYEQGANRFESVLEKIKEQSEDWDNDQSIGQAMKKHGGSNGLSGDALKAYNYMGTDYVTTQAADLVQLSTWYTDEDDGFDGGDYLVKEGYGALIGPMAAGLDLRIGQTVKEVHLKPKEVWVKTQSSDFRADFVIITLPLGVLKSGQMKIFPALHGDKKKAVERLGMGHFAKAVIAFPNQGPWPFKAFWVSVIPDQGERFSQWVNLAPVNGKRILINLAGGSAAKALEAEDPKTLMPQLHRLLSQASKTQLAPPEKLFITNWGRDPFSQGAYSFMATGSTHEDIDALAEPHEKRILFAGEATAVVGKGKNKAYYPATVHGAWLSGQREAERILAMSK